MFVVPGKRQGRLEFLQHFPSAACELRRKDLGREPPDSIVRTLRKALPVSQRNLSGLHDIILHTLEQPKRPGIASQQKVNDLLAHKRGSLSPVIQQSVRHFAAVLTPKSSPRGRAKFVRSVARKYLT